MQKNVFTSTLLLLFIFLKVTLSYGQNPSNISGLKLWLKADTGIVLNGSNVTGWNDQSGNSNHATQANSGLQPVLLPNALNNLPAVSFNGTKILQGKEISLLSSSSLTIIIVASGGPMTDAYNVLFDIGPFNPGGMWLSKNSDKFTIYSNNAIYSTPGATLPNVGFEPKIFGFRKQFGLIAESFLNVFPVANSSNGAFINAFSNGPYNIGGDPTYTGLWNGNIFEIILFDKSLTDSETKLINNYLVKKYTPFLNLGPDVVVNPAAGCISATPVKLIANPNFKKYLWNTGDTLNQITVNQYGTYSVKCTDVFGTLHHDTIKIKLPTKNFNYPTAKILCNKETITWNTQLNKKENTFKWQDNSSDSLFHITQAGKYYVTITDSFGCTSTSDTVFITVDNFSSSIWLGNDTSFCSGNSIYLKKGAAQSISYLWSTGSNNDSLLITTSGKYWLTVKNVNNCTATDTINVTISGAGPMSNFSFTHTCIKNTTAFTDLSTPPPGEALASWKWDFGDASSSSLANPSHMYADTGSYIVRLTVKATNGCEVKVSKLLRVYSKPRVDFIQFITPCDNTSLQFNGTAITYGYPVISWKWKFSDPSSGINDSSSVQNPIHHYATFSVYSTQLIVTTGYGCKDTVVKSVSVLVPQKSPQLVFPPNNYSAASDSLKFSWSPVCGSPYYELNIAEDANFSLNNKLYKVYNLNADTILKKLSACKTYYWRVRAFAPVATPFSSIQSVSIFNPGCIPGLELWLDASSGAVVNSSNQVSLWLDKSGKNKNALQSAPNFKPLLIKETSVTSSKSTFVRLDGGNDFMIIDSSTKIGSFFSVFNWRGSLPNFPDYNAVLTAKSANARGFVLMGISGQSNYYIDGTNNTFSAAELEVNRVNTLAMSPLERLKMVNGITGIPVDLKGFNLGHYSTGNTFWNGDVGDIIIYSNALTSLQKSTVQEYLNDKYAPVVNLGADRTTCSFPLTLRAKKDYFTAYLWSNVSTADSLVVNAPGTYFVKTTDIFGRNSSDTIVIGQNLMGYTVNLGKNDTAICEGKSLRLTAGPPHLTYLWSTGSTANAIDVTRSGSYRVAVTDCQGKVSQDTMNVLIHPLPRYTLGKDTLFCNVNNVLDPGFLDSRNLTFHWSDNSQDSILVANHTGAFSLKVTDSYGCAFSDTVKITVDSLQQLVSLGADTTFCSGNYITLQTGASKAADYLWSTGSTNDSLRITTSGDYWVQVKSINNCIASDTIHVTLFGSAPSANFSFLNSCLKKEIPFTDTSVPPAGETLSSWNWNFGDLAVSTLQNPTHVYADTGKFTVRLTVGTTVGCYTSVIKTINIYPKPKIDFTVSSFCENSKTKFSGVVTTLGYPATQWAWNFADPASGSANVSALQNPEHVYVNSGIYPVALQVLNTKGCADTLIKNVVINANPVADFSYSIPCKDDTVSFKDLTTLPSGTTNTGNYWNFGNGISTLLNPQYVFPASVTYTVLHVVTASNGCKDTVSKKINVHASPAARFTNSNSCESGPTQFTDQSLISIGSITAWQWTFENKARATLKNPQYSFVKTGNTIVKQVVISDFGCKDSITKTIVVYAKPKADFTATPEYGNPGLSVKFTNTSTGAATYLWNFDDGATSTAVNPTHIYADTGTYQPILIATSTIGCVDTAWGKVLILKRFIDVAITGTTAKVQNGGGVLLNNYLNVHVNLLNKSTTDVFALDFYLEGNDGTAIKETWTGKLLKGGIMGYDFKATPNVKSVNQFICVYALNPNGLKDEVPADNKMCSALDETNFKVLDPYPNPTEDLLVIPVIVPAGGELILTVVDSRGREVEKIISDIVAKGLQQLTLDARVFEAGLYVCRVQFGDQVILSKFIKK